MVWKYKTISKYTINLLYWKIIIFQILPENNYPKFKDAIECESKVQLNNIITEMANKFILEGKLK